MIPNAAEITRRRVTAATVIRFFAFIPLLISLIPIFEMLNIWINPNHWEYGEPLAAIGPMIGAAILLGAAAVIWALAPWSARRAIKVPRFNTCPACRYKLEGLNAPQCPECGLTLTPEYLSSDLGDDPRDHDTIFLRQVCVLVLRTASLIACIPLAVWFFGSLIFLLLEGFSHSEIFEYAMQLSISGVGLAVAAGFILFSSPIAVIMVPRRERFLRRADNTTADPESA